MSQKIQKILILTASFGNGHITASKALKERFLKEGKTVQILDIAQECWGGKFLGFLFENAPVFFLEKSFDAKNYAPAQKFDTKISEFLFGKILKKTLSSFSPDEVFCTFPLATLALREIFSGKISVQITDYYSPHLSWGWGNPDEVFCLDATSKQILEEKFPEISPQNIQIHPFPLSQKITEISGFSQEKKQEIKTSLVSQFLLPKAYAEKKVFLLFFHHVLLGNEEEIIQKFLNNSQYSNYCLWLVAGKNAEIFSHYAENSRIHIFSWIDDIAPFYAVANMVGGKCGGAFLSEVMALDLPLVITGVFSGQEKGNQKFLEKEYAKKLREV